MLLQFAFNTANVLLQGGHIGLVVLVQHNLVLDELDTLGETKGGESFRLPRRGRGNIGDEEGLGVASERVLEQEGKLGIAVVDEVTLAVGFLHQGIDNVPQHQERLVDVRGLLQPITGRVGVLLPLRSCQIDQIELGLLQGHNISIFGLGGGRRRKSSRVATSKKKKKGWKETHTFD